MTEAVDGVVTKATAHSVEDTVARLLAAVAARGRKVFRSDRSHISYGAPRALAARYGLDPELEAS